MKGLLRFGAFALLAASSAASPASDDFWQKLGDVGGPLLWGAGLGSSLIQDGTLGKDHALRTADGFIVSLGLAEGLKFTVRERRPYEDTLDSFPSLHTTLSFEVAAAQSYYHPRQAVFWFGAASLIAYSRIPAHEHHWQDIIGGALLGYGSGQLSVSSRRGWILAPTFERGRLGGLAMRSIRF